MIAGLGVRLRFRPRPRQTSVSPKVLRWKIARAALIVGLAAFVLATVGLSVAVESVKPEWRDPEFGHRLRQLRKWKAEAPHRPLVLVLGSSRDQMGISPRAMNLPNGPTDPLVYNFGYRGALPLWSWLILMRLLDCGIKPDFVLVEIALAECVDPKPAEQQLKEWTSRLSLADIRRLRSYTEDQWYFSSDWIATRPLAWSEFSEAIRSDLLPKWQSHRTRANYDWEIIDEFGYAPHPADQVTAAERDRQIHAALHMHRRSVAGAPVSEMTRRVHRDLVDRCRAEGIVVAFSWSPESPRYRQAFSPARTKTVAGYTHFLHDELGSAVFPVPDCFAEEDFADGHHLLHFAAARYSRWIAETHLKQWLAGDRPMAPASH
jgi:hypothetical protein